MSVSYIQAINASCGGSLMFKSEQESWQLFYILFKNFIHNTCPSILKQLGKRGGMLEIGIGLHLQGQFDNLSRKVYQLLYRQVNKNCSICAYCERVGHNTENGPCLNFGASSRQVNSAQGFSMSVNDPYSSTYNLGWINHPNFGWLNNPGMSHKS